MPTPQPQPAAPSLAGSYARFEWVVVVLLLLAIAAHLAAIWSGSAADGPLALANLPLLVVITIGGVPLVVQIAVKVWKRDFGADFLAVIAFITGVVLSEYLAATLVILMLTGGQVLETYAMRKASSALRVLADRMPTVAHRRVGEEIEDVAVDEISIGDEIAVFPHDTAPVDGTVIEGHGSMDESYLTGEPYQVSKAPGASVLSGAINGDALILVRCERPARDSRYAQIMGVMQEAEQRRPTLRRLGDQLGAVFAPLALLFALATWYVTGDSTRFLAVLVVTTPCPLLIAIPITIISAVSMAARRAIVIRDPTVLERLPTCRTAIFDKTGTLTFGRPQLTDMIAADGFDRDLVLAQTASLERYSKHPLASAILQGAKDAGLALHEADHVSEKPGQGLSGRVSGRDITVTHRGKLAKTDPALASRLPPTEAGLECLVLVDGAYAATFRFRDAPREDGKPFISHLGPTHDFKKIMLVSGDRESEVAYLAGLLGIEETLASQSPEQKVAIVLAETAKAPTLFMGDGINDAPALASATVGIAFGDYSAVTAEAAGAIILENSLAKVDELLHIATAMRRIALQSAVGGMALSLIAMGFAAGGYISPVAGALLQEAIDVLAILNALRLTFGRRIEADLRG